MSGNYNHTVYWWSPSHFLISCTILVSSTITWKKIPKLENDNVTWSLFYFTSITKWVHLEKTWSTVLSSITKQVNLKNYVLSLDKRSLPNFITTKGLDVMENLGLFKHQQSTSRYWSLLKVDRMHKNNGKTRTRIVGRTRSEQFYLAEPPVLRSTRPAKTKNSAREEQRTAREEHSRRSGNRSSKNDWNTKMSAWSDDLWAPVAWVVEGTRRKTLVLIWSLEA